MAKRYSEYSVEFANEGFTNAFIARAQNIITSNKKLNGMWVKALADLKENGSKKDNIVNPSWGENFPLGKQVNGGDILSLITKIYGAINETTIEALIDSLSKIKKLAVMYDRPLKFGRGSYDMERQLTTEVDNFVNLLKKATNGMNVTLKKIDKNAPKEVMFKPLTYEEASKFNDVVSAITTSHIVSKAPDFWDKEINNSTKRTISMLLKLFFLSWLGIIWAALTLDSALTRDLKLRIKQPLNDFIDVFDFMEDAVHGIVRYAAASVDGK